MQTHTRHAEPTPQTERAPRILARTLFRELRAEGFDERQIRSLASELADLAEREREPPPRQ